MLPLTQPELIMDDKQVSSREDNNNWWSDLVAAEFVEKPVSETLDRARRDSGLRTPCVQHREEEHMEPHSHSIAQVSEVVSPGQGPSLPSSDDEGHLSVQDELEMEVCIHLSMPVLRAKPWLRHSRTPVTIESLRRGRRIVSTPRAANTTRQAQNVLLKKLGMHVQQDAVDAEVEAKFKAAFKGDLSDRKKEALQILLNGDVDTTAMDLDLAELEELA